MSLDLQSASITSLTKMLAEDIYDITSTIKDPEFPRTTLGELKTTVSKTRPSKEDSGINIGAESENESSNGDEKKFVINPEDILVKIKGKNGIYKIFITVVYTPTVNHCSLTSLIGLCILRKLEINFPVQAYDTLMRAIDDNEVLKYFYKNGNFDDENDVRYATKVLVFPGSHSTEVEVNRQIADKERVSAALENVNLIRKIDDLISEPDFL